MLTHCCPKPRHVNIYVTKFQSLWSYTLSKSISKKRACWLVSLAQSMVSQADKIISKINRGYTKLVCSQWTIVLATSLTLNSKDFTIILCNAQQGNWTPHPNNISRNVLWSKLDKAVIKKFWKFLKRGNFPHKVTKIISYCILHHLVKLTR